MTLAWDYLSQGEILQALITIYSELASEPFLFFIGLGGFTIVVWAATDSLPFAMIMFMIVGSSLVLSHLTQFSLHNALIIEEMQVWVLLLLIIAFGSLIWYVLTKRVM